LISDRKVIAWALYDWANSAWALSVLAVLFPLFLGSYWSDGDSGSSVTARLGWITAGSNLIVALLAPIFGTIADKGGYRKRFLVILAAIGAFATASLGLVGKGDWPLALTLYLFASIGFYSSTVFYDSLLVDVTPVRNYNFVSSLGFALGYLGGALLLALHVYMIRAPDTFGLADGNEAIRAAFATVGAWWVIFSIPLVLFVPEIKRGLVVGHGVVRAAYAELRRTIGKIRQYRNIVIFLLAYVLYMSGVFTVISMGANYGQRLGFEAKDLVVHVDHGIRVSQILERAELQGMRHAFCVIGLDRFHQAGHFRRDRVEALALGNGNRPRVGPAGHVDRDTDRIEAGDVGDPRDPHHRHERLYALQGLLGRHQAMG